MLVLNAAEQPWVRPPDQLKKKSGKPLEYFWRERERERESTIHKRE
jgi:hypothetical protein